ncbi:MAG: PD-(D/E)XK nuclease family protein [Gammaproteobacteria bacterium]|nr:PD-(D/E)XK nuclease family protein [Gammaproteobacteria bacterium]
MSHQAIQLIPYGQDPLPILAKRLLTDHQHNLPNLSDVTVILAEPQAAPLLRDYLLRLSADKGYPALLGPRILTLRDWVRSFFPTDIRVCDPHTQLLILVEALSQHPALLKSANPWALATDLVSLFDELTLNHIDLPVDLEDFTQQLQTAYGLHNSEISALGQEARLVHTLWHAWHEQLQADGLMDSQAAYLLALTQSLEQVSAEHALYLAGFHQFTLAEINWLTTLLKRQHSYLFLHGQGGVAPERYHPDAPLSRLLQHLPPIKPEPVSDESCSAALNLLFDETAGNLQARSQNLQQRYAESPLQDRLDVFMAQSAEDEASAIDIQVRQWLLEGKQRIGIVTENRRLARRVRALLERAEITLQDEAGWALSTTSAAASLERWLECLEEDFAHLPLLDLLKSPFLFPDLDPDQVRLATLRLEQDIILHENIARGLSRYRQHIQDRRQRLPDWMADNANSLLHLLDRLEDAAAPLHSLLLDRQAPSVWLEALQSSLQWLGMTERFSDDPAGSRLLQALEQMQQAAHHSNMPLSWLDLRTWLGRTLEQFHFQPPGSGQGVYLLGLAQSRLQCFDAVIIGSAERDHLPGHPNPSPFFNETVRRELGLPATTELLAERFHHFRRLLEGAPQVLITARAEQDGEPIPASPWLETLQAFHQLAWNEVLTAPVLTALLRESATRVQRGDAAPLPDLQTQPAPALPAALQPVAFSPSSYQQLLDCPYQYYAARCLKLSPQEEIRQALSKADYGQRIHQCLQAFHSQVAELPGPFCGPLTVKRRAEAIGLMNQIAEAVFSQDLADNFEHHGWLQQWQQQIPAYIDWQIQRDSAWRVKNTETRHELALTEQLKISGQLDRIDSDENQLGILDYKTGHIPKQDEVLEGEAVQLPIYALLATSAQQPVREVAYLDMRDTAKIDTPYTLADDELHTLSQGIASRLTRICEQIEQGTGLPAWGDTKTCKHCDMKLLCRRQAWDD